VHEGCGSMQNLQDATAGLKMGCLQLGLQSCSNLVNVDRVLGIAPVQVYRWDAIHLPQNRVGASAVMKVAAVSLGRRAAIYCHSPLLCRNCLTAGLCHCHCTYAGALFT